MKIAIYTLLIWHCIKFHIFPRFCFTRVLLSFLCRLQINALLLVFIFFIPVLNHYLTRFCTKHFANAMSFIQCYERDFFQQSFVSEW